MGLRWLRRNMQRAGHLKAPEKKGRNNIRYSVEALKRLLMPKRFGPTVIGSRTLVDANGNKRVVRSVAKYPRRDKKP